MINFKKIDDKDFVFINKPLSDKEEKDFSNFLKLRKTKKDGQLQIKKWESHFLSIAQTASRFGKCRQTNNVIQPLFRYSVFVTSTTLYIWQQ